MSKQNDYSDIIEMINVLREDVEKLKQDFSELDTSITDHRGRIEAIEVELNDLETMFMYDDDDEEEKKDKKDKK